MKKELVECQTQNKELGKKYMDVKEQLAAANASLAASEARMKSMQEQLNFLELLTAQRACQVVGEHHIERVALALHLHQVADVLV